VCVCVCVDPNGIGAMAASYYSSLQWVVDSIDRHTNPGMEDLSLGLGGFQVQQATPMGGAFYIENVPRIR
jgi:hypothetical protein